MTATTIGIHTDSVRGNDSDWIEVSYNYYEATNNRPEFWTLRLYLGDTTLVLYLQDAKDALTISSLIHTSWVVQTA